MAIMARLEELLVTSAVLVALAGALILKISVVSAETGFLFAYLPIAVVIWASANHCVEILEQSARGEGWAVFSLETLATVRSQMGVVVLIELAMIIGVFDLLARFGGTEVAWIFGGLAAAVLPASLALLAVTRNLLRALRPLDLLRVAFRIGLPYTGLVLAFIAVVGLVGLAFQRRGFLELFAALYASFWLAYLTGVVVYSRRMALGLHAPRSPEAKLARELGRLQQVRRRALDHAYGIASRGNLEGGLAYIYEYVASEPEPLAARQWMYFEMTHWANPHAAVVFGERLAADLEIAGQPDAAVKVRTSCAHLEEKLREARPP
jgi:hypothetical protein